MRLTIDPIARPRETIPALTLFASQSDNFEPARAIARSFDRIAKLLANGHLMAARACSTTDGGAWLRGVASEVAAVENRLTLEWHEMSAARADDGVQRYALDGAVTCLLGVLREQERFQRRALVSHQDQVEKTRGLLANAGLQPQAIQIAMDSTREVNAERQREMAALLAKYVQQAAVLEAFCADPLRARSTLGDELLSILSVQSPTVASSQARNPVHA